MTTRCAEVVATKAGFPWLEFYCPARKLMLKRQSARRSQFLDLQRKQVVFATLGFLLQQDICEVSFRKNHGIRAKASSGRAAQYFVSCPGR